MSQIIPIGLWDIACPHYRKPQQEYRVSCCHPFKISSPPLVDRIWGIWGSYYNIPKAIFYLLKGDYILKQEAWTPLEEKPQPVGK